MMNNCAHANEIYPGLWLGDITSAMDTEFLKEKKITCIINCTQNYPFVKGISHTYRVPVMDNLKTDQIYKMYTALDQASKYIYEMLPSHNILIHCHAGRQRSVAVVSAFFIKYADFDPELVIKLIRSKRIVAGHPTINFMKSIKHYYNDLQTQSVKTKN